MCLFSQGFKYEAAVWLRFLECPECERVKCRGRCSVIANGPEVSGVDTSDVDISGFKQVQETQANLFIVCNLMFSCKDPCHFTSATAIYIIR